MEFITHKSILKDHVQYWLMEANGYCHAKAYIYNDDKKRIYLGELSVSEKHRGKGLGLELQLAREQIGVDNGCTESMLWVNIGTWQRLWYKRRGYKFFQKYKGKRAQWLIKKGIKG